MRRAVVLCAAALVLGLALAGGVGAESGDGSAGWANREVTVPARADVDTLVADGYDLAEYLRTNDDGTVTINVIGSEDDFAAIAGRGYAVGATIEDQTTAETRMHEADAAIAAEERAGEIAENGAPVSPFGLSGAFGFAAIPELTVQRVDYFQNYAGWFLSVEVFDSQVNGTGTTGPTVAVSWKTDGGTYGAATTVGRYIDTDPTPDSYLYNRALIRIGAASPPFGPAAAPTPPAMVRFASSTGQTVEAPVHVWLGGGLPPLAAGFLRNFITSYMDPTQMTQRFEALAAEFSNIATMVDLPFKTNGYQRRSMAVLDSQANVLSAPGSTARAVYLEAKQFGQDGGNSVQAEFLNPGAASQPLSVTVTGSLISVRLGTGSTGAITSTAAQVVAAINANPAASQLVTASTYAGSAGGTAVLAHARVNLSDGLVAPASVQRGPFTERMLRISKQPNPGDRVGVFIFCNQHAREWTTSISCVEVAEELLRNYALDPHTREMVDNLDIFILPSANPDGSHYSRYDFNSQRRNMTRHCPITATSGMPTNRNAWGVDLNRNDSSYSLFDGYFGASASCTNDTYAGPSEVSEPETQDLHWVVDNFSNIKFSMNTHSYGGYFMWAPGSYIGAGRVSAPAPNFGIEGYFFQAADTILNRIKSYRGTAVLPQNTGPIADVLYSAAGNAADDMWYRKGIIAYSFETGVDRFTSTTSGTAVSEVGFFPAFTNEGHDEGMEFAAGHYGLIEAALEYSRDHSGPEVATVPAGPAASKTPIDVTFKWVNEASVVRYTLDGSTPTDSSPQWNRQGPRRPGTIFTFDHTTTLKWYATDIAGNVSPVQTARFAVDTTAPVTTASLAPAPVNGWYVTPTVTLSADDFYDAGGAGIDLTKYRLDGGAWTNYSGPFPVTGDGDHTLEFFSTDLAGNTEAIASQTFAIDATRPTIALTRPTDGAVYVLNQDVTVAYACDDTLSGRAGCDGTVADGGALDTSTIGPHTFTVNALDRAGNTAELTVTYRVVWPYTGFFSPVDQAPTLNVTKAGSAIPVKFALGSDRGLGILAAGYPRTAKVNCASSAPEDTIEQTVTAGQSSLSFGDGQYVYVWKTDGAWAGTCRELTVKLVDGSEHTALFRFK